jgi:hypothetical protein
MPLAMPLAMPWTGTICKICILQYAEKYAKQYAINMLDNMHNMHIAICGKICK